MRSGRSTGVATVAWIAVATAGCGLGPGQSSSGDATLTVTRDYGSVPMRSVTEADPSESETVIRFLDREAEISTRFGGGFVQSIDGVSGGYADGRSTDWFFFVNGVESPRGGADVSVRGGDRIWWDLRDWTDAMRTPAVVGSWPEPFAQVAAGAGRLPVRVECFGNSSPCDEVAGRLADEGVEAKVEGPAAAGSQPSLRLLVGPWAQVRADPVAALLDDGPATSGVFARFEPHGSGWELVALDQHAAPDDRFDAGAGLVAGLRHGDEPASWVVTGTDPAGVKAAARQLDAERLADHYAVVADPGTSMPVPEPEIG